MKGFAQALLAGPVWVDARVQRLVNAGMFALMRRGVRKSTIRRTMWRAALCAFCATIAAYLFNGERHSFWVYVIAVALPASLAWTGRLERNYDLREEARSMPALRRFQWSDRVWWWAILLHQVWDSLSIRERSVAEICEGVFAIAFWVLFLLIAYSGKTPPVPPARKVTVPARTQEAQAQ